MADEPTTTTPPANPVVEGLLPPATETPAADLVTIKVDGVEQKVSQADLIVLAQKSAHAQKTASEQGQTIVDLQKEANISKKLRAFKQDPTKTQEYREALIDLGYTSDQVEAEIAAVSVDLDMTQEPVVTETPAANAALLDRLSDLERQLNEVRSVTSGRENDILRVEIQAGLTNDPYVQSALEGVEEQAKDARLKMLAGEALSAAESELRSRRERNPSFQYGPDAAREIAGLATKQAVELAKSIGLSGPTQPGRDLMAEAGLGAEVELPKANDLSKTNLESERKFVAASLAAALQQGRVADR